MSTAIDNFTNQLYDRLEGLEDRAKSLRNNIRSMLEETQAEIQSKLDKAKVNLNANKQEIDEYWVKLKTQFEEKESELKSQVEEWKINREVKHLKYRADQAESYANTTIFLAMATMEIAEKATLEAIVARRDAEIAIGTNQA